MEYYMKRLMGALMATLVTACAQAQPATQLPKDFVEVAFNAGKSFDMAEALVKSCELAVAEPKIRQSFMVSSPLNYMETFEKGFAHGWKQAVEVAERIKIKVAGAEALPAWPTGYPKTLCQAASPAVVQEN
jgi:hypothetical protein